MTNHVFEQARVGSPADGRNRERKIAAAIRALKTTYHPCAKCQTRGAQLPDRDGGGFVCADCRRGPARNRSIANARQRLDRSTR